MLEPRPKIQTKRVSLFVTCIVEMIYPTTGLSVADVLENLGYAVDFPEAQTCCGQMGFNAGYRPEAKQVALQFLKAFRDSDVIVAPSGSCVAMVRHYYEQLFDEDRLWRQDMERIVANTWEFTEFLVDGLGIEDVGAALPRPMRVGIHDACHGLRGLGLHHQARALLGNVQNLTLVDLPAADQCCGFGGLFAIKMPAISGAMLADKVKNITDLNADLIVTGDASCLTQMNGGLARQPNPNRTRVVHIADVLAGRID